MTTLDPKTNHPLPAKISGTDLLIFFLLAVAIRLSTLPYWFVLPPGGDEMTYWTSAVKIAAGNFKPDFLHPPLWPYVLSLAASLSVNPLIGRLLTVLLLSSTVPLLYLVGTRVFDRKTGSIAAWLYLLYPNHIAFSHYLWAEPLAALLILIAVYFFFDGILENVRWGNVLLASLLAGLCMLVKESGFILFVSFLVVLMTVPIKKKWLLCVLAIIVFAALPVAHSILASHQAKKQIVVASAFMNNSRRATEGKIAFQNPRREIIPLFFRRYKGRFFYEKTVTVVRNFYNLWQPTSFPISRLLHNNRDFGNYHAPHAETLAYVAAGFYIFAVVMGLTGICFGTPSPFRRFAISNLTLLSAASLAFLLCTRFRLPFIYLFILYGAAVAADPRAFFKRFGWLRALTWLALVALFIHIVLTRWSQFGYLG